MDKSFKTSLSNISSSKNNRDNFSFDLTFENSISIGESEEKESEILSESHSEIDENENKRIEAEMIKDDHPHMKKMHFKIQELTDMLKHKNYKATSKIDKKYFLKDSAFKRISSLFRNQQVSFFSNLKFQKIKKIEEAEKLIFNSYELAQQRILTEEHCYIIYKDKTRLEKLKFEKKRAIKKNSSCLKFWINIKTFFAYLQLGIYHIVTNPFFEYTTLFVIMLNTVYLSLNEDVRESMNQNIDVYFLIIYCIEMILKIIAHGFILNPGSYMRNSWNVFDFFIVILSTFTVFANSKNEDSDTFNISSLRSIRVLRPLRTITKLKRLKQIVSTILSSLPNLIEILLVLLVFLSIMAITGVQLFMGVLKKRCVGDTTGELGMPCGNRECPTGYSCLDGQENPNFGVTNFDNFFSALLMIITLEGWSEIMLYLQQGYSDLVFPFFMILIFMGSIFLLNMVLAVILVKYSESEKKEIEKKEKKTQFVCLSLVKFFNKSLYLNISKQLKQELSEDSSRRTGLIKSKSMTKKTGILAQKKKAEKEKQHNLKSYARKFLNRMSDTALKLKLVFMKPKKNQVNDMSVYFNTEESSETNLKSLPTEEFSSDLKDNLGASEFIRSIDNSEKIQRIHSPRRKTKPRRSESLKKYNGSITKSFFEFEIFPIKEEKEEDGTPHILGRARLKNKLKSKKNLMRRKSSKMKKTRGEGEWIFDEKIEDDDNFHISDDEKFNKSNYEYKEDKKVYKDWDLALKDSNLEPTVKRRKKKKKKDIHETHNDIDFLPTKISSIFQKKVGVGKVYLKKIKPSKSIKEKKIINSKIIKFFEMEGEKERNNSQLETNSVGNSSRSKQEKSQRTIASSVSNNSKVKSTLQSFLTRKNLKKSKSVLTEKSFLDSAIRNLTKKKIERIKKKPLKNIKKEVDWTIKYNPSSIFNSTRDVIPTLDSLNEKNNEILMNKMRINYKGVKYKKQKKTKFLKEMIGEVLANSTGFPLSDENIRTYFVYRSHQLPFELRNLKDRFNFKIDEIRKKKLRRTKFNAFGSSNMLKNKTNLFNTKTDFSNLYFNLPVREIPLARIKKYSRDFKRMETQISFLRRKKRKKKVIHRKSVISGLELNKNTVNFTFDSLIKRFKIEFENERLDKLSEDEEEKLTENEKFYRYVKSIDHKKGNINSLNWSGPQVLKYSGFTKNQKNILKSLNDKNLDLWMKTFSKRYKRFKYKLHSYVVSPIFQKLVIFLVILNTFFLALDNLIPAELIVFVRYTNIFFTIIFFIEMIIKLLAFGFADYLRDFVNIFDGLVSILGMFELIYISINGIDINSPLSALRSLRLFRALRVFRMTRVIRSLKYMKVILEVLIKSIDQFFYIAIILLLFIIIFTLLGMEIFSDELEKVDSLTRISFSSFSFAFLSVFQIMTMENWQELLFLTFRAEVNKPMAIVFLIVWIFIGNYIFLNLFLAILLDGFTDPNAYIVIKEINNEEEELDFLLEKFKKKEKKMRIEKETEEKERENFKWVSVHDDHNKHLEYDSRDRYLTKIPESSLKKVKKTKTIVIHFEKKDSIWITKNPYKGVCCTYSLLIFKKNNRLRLFAAYLTSSKAFDIFILIIIVASSIKLVISTYLDTETEGTTKTIFDNIDFAISIIFLVECILKILRNGFVIPKNSYLRDSWNQIDFFIVLSSIVNFFAPSGNDFGFLKVLRILKTLRPLRFISHNKSMKLIVNALVGSLGAILNVLIVILMIWVMWSIVGINLLSSKLGYCSDPSSNLDTVFGMGKEECLKNDFVWNLRVYNFENIYESLTTLFVISTLEGWPNIMYSAMDGDYEATGPEKNINYYICWFFISFVLIGGLILVNLFIGVIGFRFSEEQEKLLKAENMKGMTDEQRNWIYLLKMIKNSKPKFFVDKVPRNKILRFLYNVIKSRSFEASILGCIFLNIVSLGFHYYDQPDGYENVLVIINLVFTIIFILETFVKILVMGKNYFIDDWNKFDFSIVVMSIFDLILFYVVKGNSSFLRVGPQIIRILRIFRISRLFKLLKSKKLEGFKKILRTLKYAFSSFASLFALLMIIYFVYSVLGVFLFSTKTMKSDESDFSNFNNTWVNFNNFGWALLTMFRCSTGEDWHLFMSNYGKSEKTTTFIAYIFFISFELISSFILLNLLVLVVINQFEIFYFNRNFTDEVMQESQEIFNQVWNKYTEKTQGKYIHESKVVSFMMNLPVPLGYQLEETNKIKVVDGIYKIFHKLKCKREKIYKDIFLMEMIVNPYGLLSYRLVFLNVMKKAFGRFKMRGTEEKDIKFIKKIELDTLTHIVNSDAAKFGKFLEKNKNVKELKKKKSQEFVNPLSRILFAKMAYKVWVRYARDMMKNEKQRVKRNIRKLRNSVISQKLPSFSDRNIETKSLGNSPEKEKLKLEVENLNKIKNLIQRASFSDLDQEEAGDFKIKIFDDEF